MKWDEDTRMAAHPLIEFRDGPAGRRPALVNGPEVADVVGAIVGGDVPDAERTARASDLMAISPAMVEAALAYYADFADEVDAELEKRAAQAELEENRWRTAQGRQN